MIARGLLLFIPNQSNIVIALFSIIANSIQGISDYILYYNNNTYRLHEEDEHENQSSINSVNSSLHSIDRLMQSQHSSYNETDNEIENENEMIIHNPITIEIQREHDDVDDLMIDQNNNSITNNASIIGYNKINTNNQNKENDFVEIEFNNI